MRRWRRHWLLTRLDVHFNGWRALAEGALTDQAAEPREGYDDGWMGARMVRRLAPAGDGHRVVVGGELPAWPGSGQPPRFAVYADRRLIGEFRPPAIGAFRLAFALPRELAARSELEIAVRASSTFVPSRHGISTDDRRLSCIIRELALEG
jgi:hypothetical protein